MFDVICYENFMMNGEFSGEKDVAAGRLILGCWSFYGDIHTVQPWANKFYIPTLGVTE